MLKNVLALQDQVLKPRRRGQENVNQVGEELNTAGYVPYQ